MKFLSTPQARGWLLLGLLVALTAAIYCQGLHGPFIFDDYPNIVDNDGVHIEDASLPNLVRAALASPASEFKRPLASLSFGMQYLVSGNDPMPMKAVNVIIHLLNGVLAFLIARLFIRLAKRERSPSLSTNVTAALVAGFWLLLPINLTSVLYVVQRMESLANLFVLAGLLGYTHARERMQASTAVRWPLVAAAYIGACTLAGLMAKETAVMLPMYAFVVDLCLFGFRSQRRDSLAASLDRRVLAAFGLALLVPMIIGLAWLLPGLLNPGGWATRNFTLGTRLLTELRVVVSYIGWTILPTGGALSFYHDDIVVSSGLFTPWTTVASGLALAGLGVIAYLARRRFVLVTLGILLFASCQALTGTILPLELVYEHRNYFASLGLLIAFVPLLTAGAEIPWRIPRYTLLAALMLISTALLAETSRAWNNPVTLARELAERAPRSPRAQYELGRTYVVMSRYDPASPFTPLVYAPLEQAMPLPGSSILPEQALIFFNARMRRPIKDAWWDSLIEKLNRSTPTVQDESALSSLAECLRSGACDLSKTRLLSAYLAALNHTGPSARLLAMYGNFAWNSLNDRELGLRALQDAVRARPAEAAYRVTLARMLVAVDRREEALDQRKALSDMNVGGALDNDIASLDSLMNK